MRGVVVFDDRSDLAFYTLDREMEEYVVRRITELDVEAGAPPEEMASMVRDMRDMLSAFFLPFYTSFDVLNSLKKPVLTISGADGFLIVFRRFCDNVYIAVSKEEGDSEEVLTKKLFVYNRIITLLYGPVDSKMNPADIAAKKHSQAKLSSLIRSYENLLLTDQVFLVEALEHVQFGQLSAAANVVQKLAKDTLEQSQNGGLPGVRHAMLLVNTKILSMCGRSPRIETADILMITLLIHNLFHDTQDGKESEEGGEQRAASDVTEQTFPEEMDNVQEDGEQTSDRDTVFQTPQSTPGPGGRTSSDMNDGDELSFATPRENALDMDDIGIEVNEEPSQEEEATGGATEGGGGGGGRGRGISARMKSAIANISFGGSNRRSTYTTRPTPAGRESAKFVEQLVFLQPHKGHYLPHYLYCLQVYQGIVLVLVAEHRGVAQLPGNLCQTLLLLDGVFSSGGRHLLPGGPAGQGTFDVLDDAIKRINDQIRRELTQSSLASGVGGLRQQISRVQHAWHNLKQAGLRAHLERGSSNSSFDAEPGRVARLEACGCDLRDKLVKLFELLYLAPKQREYDTRTVVAKLMRHFSSMKLDYGEFLALKGILNIPMVSFSMTFPGMMHFIFIDRSFDELTAPSLPITSSTGIPYVERAAVKEGENASVFLRRKIWEMVQRAQRYLGLGYTSQTWLDDHFLYSYYLWVNIPNTPLGHPIRFYAPTNVRSGEYSNPGVIGSSFFGEVCRNDPGEGYVYELYCMHESRVPIKEAAMHCKLLAEQLWPSSKEAIAPFSLIN